MPKNTKNKSNIFAIPSSNEETGYSEEQEKSDLVELGILDSGDSAIETYVPKELTVDDVFSTMEEQKKLLSVMRNNVAVMSDKSKMKNAKMLIGLSEQILNGITTSDLITRVIDGTNTSLDFKFLVDSLATVAKLTQNLMRLDSINESGDAGALAIQLTTASGTEIKIAAK